MAATGHQTMTVFKRDNTVSREEIKALVQEKTDRHLYGRLSFAMPANIERL
jgi:hypothetical protein